MVRGRRTTRAAAFRRQRRSRRERTNNTLPSARSILSNVYRTVLQVIWNVSSTSKADAAIVHYDVNSTTLFGNNTATPGYETIYRGAFREFKVHKIDAHYMPFRGMNRDGEYCFVLADSGELATASLNTFYKSVGAPGSVVRKAWQPSRLTWFPTESDDRNWHVFKDGHNWCVIGLSSVGYASDQNLDGKIIADLHISFRGKPDSFTLDDDLRQEMVRCDCRKCRRISRIRIAQACQMERHGMTARASESEVDGFEDLDLHSPTQ